MDEKTNQKQIVKQHNNLIKTTLRNFTAAEQNIFIAICYRLQGQGSNKVILTFDDIRSLANLNNTYSNKDIFDFIGNVKNKFGKLRMEFVCDGEYIDNAVFPTFIRRPEKRELEIQVGDCFAYLFNELTQNYTAFELREFMSLHSVYAKNLYKHLKRFRRTGKWEVSIDKIRECLGVPDSYTKTNDIYRKIIEPAVDENKQYFRGLKCTSNSKKGGRGRPSITSYTFTFRQEEKYVTGAANIAEHIATTCNWTETERFCPECKKKLYKKYIEDPGYYIFGHTDFRTGGCSWATNDIKDTLSKEEL